MSIYIPRLCHLLIGGHLIFVPFSCHILPYRFKQTLHHIATSNRNEKLEIVAEKIHYMRGLFINLVCAVFLVNARAIVVVFLVQSFKYLFYIFLPCVVYFDKEIFKIEYFII